MTSSLKPLTVWGTGGPNPPKVLVILEELSIPYVAISTSLAEVKQPPYLAINPNGRLPALHDPNTGLTLWESGAIVDYLIERYDTSQLLSFKQGSNEAYLCKQWLFFQTSGQGPYYGQASWFKKFHPEEVPSAIERYVKEVNRVTGVLEGVLRQNTEDGEEGPWLVGGKVTFADLAFLPWQTMIARVLKEEFDQDVFPCVKAWLGRLRAREAVMRVEATAKPFERFTPLRSETK